MYRLAHNENTGLNTHIARPFLEENRATGFGFRSVLHWPCFPKHPGNRAFARRVASGAFKLSRGPFLLARENGGVHGCAMCTAASRGIYGKAKNRDNGYNIRLHVCSAHRATSLARCATTSFLIYIGDDAEA